VNKDYLSELELLLSKNEDYVVEDKVNKNKVAELAHKYDADLVDLLAGNKAMRQLFFVTTKNDVLVFNKDKFIQFINNKEFLPDSFTAYKNKVGLATGTELLSEKKEVVLNWAYKDCILEGGQDKEETKRDEVFHNEVLAPDQIDRLLDEKVLTGWKRYDKDGEHKANDIKRDNNLIIRGNNLLALHSLRKRYTNKVKLIYIDPPYNTGSDSFGYNDRFNQSTWLTFMRNRIEVATKLLAEDGVFVIQIDDNQLAELKLLCTEIFKKSPSGKSNFVQYVEVKANVGAANEYQNPFMPKNCEYLLVFARNYDKRTYKPIWIKSEVDSAYSKIILNPTEKDFHKWQVGSVKNEFEKETSKKMATDPQKYYDYVLKNISRIFRTIDPKGAGSGLLAAMQESITSESRWSIYRRESSDDILCYKGGMVRFYSKNLQKDESGNEIIARELGSLWTDISWTGIASEGGVKLKNGKKPERLLGRIIEMATEPGDLVLDYHLGCGTTAAVAHKLGRKYIGIEQLDYGENDAIVRLKNVIAGDASGISQTVKWEGGGEFVYCYLMDLGNKFIEEVKKANTDRELIDLLEQAKKSSFLSYKVAPEKINPGDKDFKNLSIAHKKQLLLELVDQNHLYVNYSEIDDSDYGVSAEDKELNKLFYGK
jgi:adenine-specific DNA-methyltransferase